MNTSVRSCLSYDLSNAIKSPSNIDYFKEKKCIVVMDVVMTLRVPAKVIIHDDIRDNNAFFVEIISTLKAINSSSERSYDKQNITRVVISYEIYQTSILLHSWSFHIIFIKLAEASFDKSHMKRPLV